MASDRRSSALGRSTQHRAQLSTDNHAEKTNRAAIGLGDDRRMINEILSASRKIRFNRRDAADRNRILQNGCINLAVLALRSSFRDTGDRGR
jgi:hypothetical protein